MAASPIFSFGYPTPIPLSPRSHNTPTRRAYDFSPIPFAKPASAHRLTADRHSFFCMHSTPPITPQSYASSVASQSGNGSRRASPATEGKAVPQRRHGANPLTRSSEQRRQQKREAFLEGVMERRSDRLLEGRGDRLLHLDYLNQRRQWEREQAANAPSLDSDNIDNGDDPMVLSGREADNLLGYPSSQIAGRQAHPGFGHTASDIHSSYSPSHNTSASQPMDDTTTQHSLHPDPSSSNHDDDAALDEVLEAESRELEYLVQTHQTMPEDHDLPPGHHWHSSMDHNDHNMQQSPSSPDLWGSDDGDDSFEGELWRLGDSVDGNAGVMRDDGDAMDVS